MKNKKAIKEIFERKVNLLKKRPSIGKGSVTTNIMVKEGLTCEIKEGEYEFIADLSKKSGGQSAGPTPGTFGRAAFGSCLAITYMLYASKMEVPIDSLEIEVEVDYDARGMYGFKGVFPGYTEVRYTIKIESPVTEETLIKVLDKADQHSPYLAVFSQEQTVKRNIRLTKTQQFSL